MVLVKLGKNKGFTLIELAMVLFIVSLLLGAILTPLATSIEQENRQQAEDMLEEIRDTLIGYAIINGRLPCPDCPDSAVGTCNAGSPNDGIEDRSGSPLTCRTSFGNLPWVDLQVDENDPWGNHVTYQVSSDYSRDSNTSACGTETVGVSFELCTVGTIDVRGAYSASYSGNPDIADNVVAIVISHGKNYLDQTQQNQEVENYGRNPVNPDTGSNILSSYTATDYDGNVFIKRDYSQSNDDITYDDLMIWVSPNTLMNKMVSAGKLP